MFLHSFKQRGLLFYDTAFNLILSFYLTSTCSRIKITCYVSTRWWMCESYYRIIIKIFIELRSFQLARHREQNSLRKCWFSPAILFLFSVNLFCERLNGSKFWSSSTFSFLINYSPSVDRNLLRPLFVWLRKPLMGWLTNQLARSKNE